MSPKTHIGASANYYYYYTHELILTTVLLFQMYLWLMKHGEVFPEFRYVHCLVSHIWIYRGIKVCLPHEQAPYWSIWCKFYKTSSYFWCYYTCKRQHTLHFTCRKSTFTPYRNNVRLCYVIRHNKPNSKFIELKTKRY